VQHRRLPKVLVSAKKDGLEKTVRVVPVKKTAVTLVNALMVFANVCLATLACLAPKRACVVAMTMDLVIKVQTSVVAMKGSKDQNVMKENVQKERMARSATARVSAIPQATVCANQNLLAKHATSKRAQQTMC